MALAILNQPCTSRFASAVYANLRPRRHSRQTIREFSFTASALQIDRKKAVEAASENIELSEPAAYVSTSSDPWFNLSYEDWLLRNSPRDQPALFLYRNDPCVVLGRNQNPWQESTPRKLTEWGIPLIRRRSGGGTVFHDEGNTNFSIILPRLLFTRSHGANLVARAVRERLGVRECTVNERNDVTIRDEEKGKDFKVSGSAYKIIQHRAYHHGTMLISSDISNLGRALRSSSPNIQGKSVPSVRSPVSTLNTYLPPHLPTITHDTFIQAIIDEFIPVYAKSPASHVSPISIDESSLSGPQKDKVLAGVKELKSWEWTYGQTPEFSNEIEGDLSFGSISASVTARHAIITSASLHYTPPITATTETENRHNEHAVQSHMDDLALRLVGQKYELLDPLAPRAAQDTHTAAHERREAEVLRWLRENM